MLFRMMLFNFQIFGDFTHLPLSIFSLIPFWWAVLSRGTILVDFLPTCSIGYWWGMWMSPIIIMDLPISLPSSISFASYILMLCYMHSHLRFWSLVGELNWIMHIIVMPPFYPWWFSLFWSLLCLQWVLILQFSFNCN